MAEKESKFKLEAWMLDKKSLNRLWDELGRFSNGDNGYIQCKYKDGGENKYANPCELASREENRRRNEVIEVSLSRSNSREGKYAYVNFSQSNLLSPSIYIRIEKRHEDAKIDLIYIENALLSTRPLWWWVEPVKLVLVLVELVLAGFLLFIALIVLINVFLIEEKWTWMGVGMWPLVPLFGWAVIVLVSFVFRWMLPTGTLAIGEGIGREENKKTLRKSILWIAPIIPGISAVAVLIITALTFLE